MRILFYDTKKYDRDSFEKVTEKYPEIEIEYTDTDINSKTANLAKGYKAICAFVSSDVGKETIDCLSKNGVELVLLRCAGFNNVDLEEAKKKNITVMRVPGYSPEAVAEHAMALALASSRRIHKSYIKVRENNFSLTGLTGTNLHGKIAGIIGTGKIGATMCRICRGFGMEVIAYDLYKNPELDFVEYVELDKLLNDSDLISLHCPLTEESYHMINKSSIAKMKDGVILVNTSRGALIKTEDLIHGIRDKKFFSVGLDVYEEETNNVFENREDDILETSITARLLSFPNVIVTSHQGFLTNEALESISITTFENAMSFNEIDWYDGSLEIESSINKTCEIDDCNYKILSDSTVSFEGVKDYSIKSLEIPSTIEFQGRVFDVTALSKKAFDNLTKLKHLKIGNKVEIIPKKAFVNCTKLEDVIIGDSVNTIEEKVFYKLPNLKYVKIRSNTLDSIGEKAFAKIYVRAKFKLPKSMSKAYTKLINKCVPDNTFKFKEYSVDS